jgi:hypothetical protein
MGKQSDFKISFSIDLIPYVAGLKSMLTMTQAAGKQIEPLLNMKLKAPDFTGFEKELVRLQEEVKAMGVESSTMNTGIEDTGKKAGAAAPHVHRHGTAIRGMKREAMESFGAISFLAMNIVQMADSASGGSKDLQKLSQGMSQGVSAGFGLASILSVIGVASGGTAVAIGAVVTIGISLVSFFSNAEQRAEAAKKMMDQFSDSLNGASVKSLEEYRGNLIKIVVEKKNLISVLEDLRKDAAKKLDFLSVAELSGQISNLKDSLGIVATQVELTNAKIESSQIRGTEIVKMTEQAKIDAISNQYARQRAEAIKSFNDDKTKAEESKAIDEEKSNYIAAKRSALRVKLNEINTAEKNDEKQKYEEVERYQMEGFNKYLEHQKLLDGIRAETQRSVMSGFKSEEMANAKSEVDKLAIEERYAILEIDLQEKVVTAYAGSEEEKTELTKKFEAMRLAIRKGTSAKFHAADESDKKNSKAKKEQEIQDWKDSHGAAMAAISGVSAGAGEMFNQFIIGNRQAANAWDAVWLTMRNTALQSLSTVLQTELQNLIIGNAAHKSAEVTKTSTTQAGVLARLGSLALEALGNIASGATAMISAAANAVNWIFKTIPFPLSLGVAAAAVAATYGAWLGVKSMFGFEHGGKIEKGQTGVFEGTATEVIAPSQSFVDVARAELIPKAIMAWQKDIGTRSGATVSTTRMEHGLKMVEAAIKKLNTRFKFELDGGDLKSSVRRNEIRHYNRYEM